MAQSKTIYVYKLLVFDRNTWNYTNVCKKNYSNEIGIITLDHIIMYKLLVLERNILYHKIFADKL